LGVFYYEGQPPTANAAPGDLTGDLASE
jgi:hypothetical protein